MKNFFRIMALTLLLATLLCLFGGCGIIKGEDAMSYEGYVITETMYSYWMSKIKTQFLYQYNNSKDTLTFWNTEVSEGYTYEDFIVDYIQYYAKRVLISMYLFDEYGLSFSDSQKKTIEEKLDELTLSYGGKNAFNEELGEMGLNIQTLERIYYEEAKVDCVDDYFFKSGGILEVTDNDREAYYKANYYCAKWIYIYTNVKLKTDEDGNYIMENGVYQYEDITDENEKQEKLNKVAQVKDRLAAGESFETVRKELTEENIGYDESLPNGIYLSNDDFETYGVDMIDALKNLEVGQYSFFDNGYATVFVKKQPLRDYGQLTDAELEIMPYLDDYVKNEKSETFYNGFEIEIHQDVIEKYDIKTIKGSKNTTI